MDLLLLFGLIAALDQSSPQTRAPDSHDLRRERGDIVVVDGRPEGAAPASAPPSQAAAPCPGPKNGALIGNPAEYGLPAAGAGRHWIRYGNDALLVASADGRVIEVVSNQFR